MGRGERLAAAIRSDDSFLVEAFTSGRGGIRVRFLFDLRADARYHSQWSSTAMDQSAEDTAASILVTQGVHAWPIHVGGDNHVRDVVHALAPYRVDHIRTYRGRCESSSWCGHRGGQHRRAHRNPPLPVNSRKRSSSTCAGASAATWPEKETVADASQGVQLATMQKLAHYWATDYDWRKVEARLNALPQFITEIDGLDIHFIHVRSKHENALPIIVTHGWPGSIIEQLKIIDPLTNPTAHGGSAADAFHVVIPSLPGYGFSGKPTAPGWDPVTHRPRLGDADATPRLHAIRGAGRRLGQRRLGDDGPAAPPGLLGIHTNMAATVPAESRRRSRAGRRRRPASRRMRSTRGISSATSTGTGWPTPSRWAPPADAVRDRRFAGRPRRVDARS